MVCNQEFRNSYCSISPARLVYKVPGGSKLPTDVDRNGYERVALAFDRVHDADQEPSLEK